MSPLIDISFLLLIYFLVTSTLEPVESDLALTLPDPGLTAHRHVPDPMAIEITETGAILANNELLDLDADSRDLPMLLDRLRTYAESARLTDSPARVSISADDQVDGQRLVDVMNVLADQHVGIEEVMLAGFTGEP
jgi:biopolymer transport protein ExbD